MPLVGVMKDIFQKYETRGYKIIAKSSRVAKTPEEDVYLLILPIPNLTKFLSIYSRV